MTNRRRFIKRSLLFLGGTLTLPYIEVFAKPLSLENKKTRRICVLHTNDFHSHFEAFPSTHPTWPNQGGILQLGGLIQQIRSEEENVLLFDCGDVFQGTPYFNFFEGKPELQWMEKMGYHAGTLGNHDFDLGIDHLAKLKSTNAIPLVNCNYDFENTSLKNLVKTHIIIEKNGLKIGVTGASIHLQGLLTEDMYRGIIYHDPVIPVQNEVNFLRNKEKCDLVFVLSHLGYEYQDDKIDDLKLAKKTHGIDAILGGHTHTFLEKPTEVQNSKGKTVIVNQAGWAGLQLGKLVFEI
jgi:5'-nucleotidase